MAYKSFVQPIVEEYKEPEYQFSSKPNDKKKIQKEILRASHAIQKASAILIVAGAGLGIDSGLPDYRGSTGFWEDYPPAKEKGFGYKDLATPDWYKKDPHLAWGFAAHLIQMYRSVVPHEGFQILLQLCKQKNSYYVMTSNVDGEFQKAGFPPDCVYEVHGSVHKWQCTQPKKCKKQDIWISGQLPKLDEKTFKAVGTLPICPHCGSLARLNVSLFGDFDYVDTDSKAQKERFLSWINSKLSVGPLVVIEVGCGVSEHSIRFEYQHDTWRTRSGEWKMGLGIKNENFTLIRINPLHYDCPNSQTIAIPLGALAALRMLKNYILIKNESSNLKDSNVKDSSKNKSKTKGKQTKR